MKKLRTTMDGYFDRLDRKWRALPVKRQRRYTLIFFLAYLLLTAAVITGVCYDVKKNEKGIAVDPIENPIIKRSKR